MFVFIFLVLLLNIFAAWLCLAQPYTVHKSTFLYALGAVNVACAVFNFWRLCAGWY